MDVLTDESSEMVLGVEIRAGNAGDAAGALPLVEQANQIDGVQIETLLGDMAYSEGEVREELEKAGVTMVAKVPPTTNRGLYPKTEFEVDAQAGMLTCPAGQSTTKAIKAKDHKGKPGLTFIFSTATCAACPIRNLCLKPTQIKGRTIFVGRHHDRIAAARKAQQDPEVKALLRRRAKIERKIDHLQDLGARKARYRGRRKTKLQILLGAAVA
ncbi:MAG: transposase, partial [Actinomycetota bacterium]